MEKPSEVGCCGSYLNGCCHDEQPKEESCECGQNDCSCESEEKEQGGCGCGCDC